MPGKLDVNAIPGWLLWLCAAAALLLFFGAILRIIPPARRTFVGRRLLVIVLVLLVVPIVHSASRHASLLLGTAIFLGASLPLFWYGPMPADMPLANEPGLRQHPRYREFARRGKIAGYLIAGWIVAVIVLASIFLTVD